MTEEIYMFASSDQKTYFAKVAETAKCIMDDVENFRIVLDNAVTAYLQHHSGTLSQVFRVVGCQQAKELQNDIQKAANLDILIKALKHAMGKGGNEDKDSLKTFLYTYLSKEIFKNILDYASLNYEVKLINVFDHLTTHTDKETLERPFNEWISPQNDGFRLIKK